MYINKVAICTTIKAEHKQFLQEHGLKVSALLEEAIEMKIKLWKNNGETDEVPSFEELQRKLNMMALKMREMNLALLDSQLGTK